MDWLPLMTLSCVAGSESDDESAAEKLEGITEKPGADEGGEEAASTALALFEKQGFLEGGDVTSALQITIPGLDLGTELQHLTAEEWCPGCLIVDWMEAEGVTDAKVSPWQVQPGDGVTGIRRLEACVPVSMFPGAAPRVRFIYRIDSEATTGSDGSRRVQSITVNRAMKAEVPFGECFHVQEQIVLKESTAGISVSKSFQVVFEQSTWMQRVILANTASEQAKSAANLQEVLQGRVKQEAEEPAEEESRTFEVWEVRRCLDASGCWQACLSGMQTNCCWLDLDYKRCELDASAKPRNLARCSKPPVQLPEGYRVSSEGWSVVPAPGRMGGWQFSYGFCRSDRFWGHSASGRRWQRRRWRCKLEKAVPGEEGPANSGKGQGSHLENGLTFFVIFCAMAAALHPGGSAGCSALCAGKANLPFFTGLT